jgi:opacity protein-like surface antigen
MKRILFLVMSFVLIGCSVMTFAAEANVVSEAENSSSQAVLSLYSLQANWTFSGTVTNESDERYHYFLQIQRDNARFHALATLIDGQSKAVILYEESNTLIDLPELTHWQVGNIFLRFNPINASWVFGVKGKDKKGFNFKVDMLGLENGQLPKQQNLRAGIELQISQTGRLNGHIQRDENGTEQFVTAKKSWFRQIWVSKSQAEKHRLNSVLCDFNNGSAFYSVTIPEADAVRASVAGWRDDQGKSVTMSQFVTALKEKENAWRIRVSAPKTDLFLDNLLAKLDTNQQLVVGMVDGASPGFCAISQDEIT